VAFRLDQGKLPALNEQVAEGSVSPVGETDLKKIGLPGRVHHPPAAAQVEPVPRGMDKAAELVRELRCVDRVKRRLVNGFDFKGHGVF